MTIIPFRVQNTLQQERTVVTDDTNFDLHRGAVLIKGLDRSQFDGFEAIPTYDLRVGNNYRDHRWVDSRGLSAGGVIKLEPGAAVIIETLEELHFPDLRFGQIAPKVGLLERGIANTPSKVDPGYRGNLNVTVFNHGRRQETLAHGQRFCALFVTDVDLPVDTYRGQAKRVSSAPGARRSRWAQATEFLDRRAGVVSAGAAILGVIATVISSVVAIIVAS